MNFTRAHQSFLNEHLERRSGERKGRLARGHGYAEKLFLQNVWWPLFGSFEHLHPEYEVYDWNRKSQFLDFAFLPSLGRFGLECDGYQTHVKEMDRQSFSYSLNRDSFLTGMGWRMLHFSFDDIKDRPEVCRMLLQLAVGKTVMLEDRIKPAFIAEKEILRLAWQVGRAIRPIDVSRKMNVDFRTAKKWLQTLVTKGWLQPISSGRGVLYYELKEGTLEILMT